MTQARQTTRDPLRDRLRTYGQKLSPASLRVAQFLDEHRLEAITLSALELARVIGTSDATVVRTVQTLGFGGMQDLRRQLATSHLSRDDLAAHLDRTFEDAGHDASRAMQRLVEVARAGLQHLAEAPGAAGLDRALGLLRRAPRIAVFGIGPTAYLAGYVGHQRRRAGGEAVVLDQTGIGLGDQLLGLKPGDCGLLLAYGTPYREARIVCDHIRVGGGTVVLITDSSQMEKALQPDVAIMVPRGHPDRAAFHGTTLTCLEMLLLGLAASDQEAARDRLERLRDLRAALTQTGRKP